MKTAVFFTALFFVILNTGSGAPKSCPENIEPCKCQRLAYGLYIVCANFNNTRSLVNVLTHLRTHEVQSLLFHNLVLNEVFPKDLFQGLSISEIKVDRSYLIFPQPAFEGLDESLKRLNIAGNSIIQSSEKFAIASLTNLIVLNMENSPLDVVEDNWLNYKIPSVQEITLKWNEITEIESRVFADLFSLKTITIAENKVKVVERSMFPKPAINLISIDLSGNEIESLPEDFFSEMPVLKKVMLSGNDLTTLDETTWRPVWPQLDIIMLLDNNLICDSSMNWITKAKPSKIILLYGTCVAPGPLVGKDLKDVYDLH